MNRHNLFAYARIIIACIIFTAIIVQMNYSIEQHWNLVNFFSFFTIQSNILAAIILLIVGIGSLLQQKSNPQFALLRGAATLYMTMTGIIYLILLSGNEVALQTTVPWVNFVLHYAAPVIIVLDWLFFPPQFKLPFSKTIFWLSFPAFYLAYSLIRGAFTDWYPYPFLNPLTDGWGSVIMTCLVISIGAAGLSGLLALRSKRPNNSRNTLS